MTVQPTDHELLSHVCLWCIKPQRYVAIFQHSPSPQISLHKSVFAPLDKGNCCCLSYFLKTEMNSRPFKLFSCRFVSHYESTLQNIRSSTYSFHQCRRLFQTTFSYRNWQFFLNLKKILNFSFILLFDNLRL